MYTPSQTKQPNTPLLRKLTIILALHEIGYLALHEIGYLAVHEVGLGGVSKLTIILALHEIGYLALHEIGLFGGTRGGLWRCKQTNHYFGFTRGGLSYIVISLINKGSIVKKINIVCVGKLKEGYWKEAVAEYSRRLSKFCALNIIELSDCGIEEKAIAVESSQILKVLDGSVVLLDLGGEQKTSEEFATLLDKEFISSAVLTFVIGGSYGVDARVKNAAAKHLCFGKITFPHQLMRVVLLEQIYRGFNILANTPYHK